MTLPLAGRALTGVHYTTSQCWRTRCNRTATTDLGLCHSCLRDLKAISARWTP